MKVFFILRDREGVGVKEVRPDILLVTGALFAMAVTFLVFYTALDTQFVALDDYEYVINNNHIATLGWNTVWWSFTSFYQGNWHPLTMLSFAFDRQLWGFDPFGYHLINILLHCVTVFVLCYVYTALLRLANNQHTHTERSQRGIIIGSIAGALFFGLHPLRVESVVWISERKDVLCLLFMVSAVWFYLRYAAHLSKSPSVPFWRVSNYWAAVVLAGLAVLSKPSAVSMPLILCILDWYPLRRWSGGGSFFRSTIDKTPFVIFSVLLAVLTMRAQQVAMKVFEELDLSSRLLVASKAFCFYLGKTLWPYDLAAFYVHPGNVASTAPGGYLLYVFLSAVLIAIVLVAGRQSRMWPALLFYYVVTLAPMLGIVQVGGQWAADRYSYLPALGLSLLWGGGIVWLINHLDSQNPVKYIFTCLSLVICPLLFYTFLTIRQIPVWSTTETLASRIIELQPDRVGPAVFYARAIYRNHAGQHQLALEDIGAAMKMALRQNYREFYSKIAYEQALILKNLGRLPEALAIIEWGIQSAHEPPPADAVALHDELKNMFETGSMRVKKTMEDI